MKSYKAYLFDMDGTLVNSEPLKGLAISRACHEFGTRTDFHCYKEVMGRDWPTVTGHFFRQAGITPDLDQFNRYFRYHYETLLSERLELNKGVSEYLQHLNVCSKKCALVSSAATWMVEQILEQLELSAAFDVVITQDHVSRHKPDPQAYQLALNELHVTPSDALVFEDSGAGIAAGHACGCDVIAFVHEFNGQNDMSLAMRCISDYQKMVEDMGCPANVLSYRS